MKKTNTLIICLLLCFHQNTATKAQVLRDTSTFNMMCKGVDYIYNFQFNQARDVYRKIQAVYPEHPITFVFRGLVNYWEHYPLISTSPTRQAFENDMKHAIDLCEKKNRVNYEAEYLLSNISARGLLLLFYADNELSMEVVSVASNTYQYIKKSFNYTQTYADFYFITGLYNYYREAYPEAHPVYKPLALLFPKGDREKGLDEMQIAARRSIVLKAEAYSFLSGIYISFENNYPQALHYSKSLHELYPRNVQYFVIYVKNLLLMKRYGEAEGLIKSFRPVTSNTYTQTQLTILQGIIYEKKYHDLKQAKAHYEKGIRDIKPYGEYGSEFAAYAYFGLSRISEAAGDKHLKKAYRKQAMDLSDFKEVNFDE